MGRGVRVSLPYVQRFTDRHGTVRHYFRRPGHPRIALPGRPNSPEFQLAYQAAMAGARIVAPSRPASAPGSVSATIAAYYTDHSFLALAAGTQEHRRAILERIREKSGHIAIARLEQKHIAITLSKKRPFAARNWLKAIRGLMQFAKRIGLRPEDPTQGIEMVRAPKSGGHHTWTEDEIAIFEQNYAVGTRERLALAVLLYTAARRGDAVMLGRQHIRSGRLVYRQQKTGRALSIPIHPALAENIAASAQDLTFIVAPKGRPYTPKGFGKWFRRVCDAIGLAGCSAHGLRKAQARRLAEAGCSAHEIAAITGHKTLAEVQRYADAANQSKLAEMAFRKGAK